MKKFGVMRSVYNYIMRKDVRNFGDEMWIHNCYKGNICMRTLWQLDPNCHVPQPSLTNDDFKNLQEAMNARMHMNLLDPDSTLKDDEDYNFAIMPTDKYELISHISDDNRELEYTKATIDSKHIICNKFTECFTMGVD